MYLFWAAFFILWVTQWQCGYPTFHLDCQIGLACNKNLTLIKSEWEEKTHRLNMELDLQSLLGSFVQLYPLAETPQLPPSPRIWVYEGATGQPR